MVIADMQGERGIQQSRIGSDCVLDDGTRRHSPAGKLTGIPYFEEGLVQVMGLGRKRAI